MTKTKSGMHSTVANKKEREEQEATWQKTNDLSEDNYLQQKQLQTIQFKLGNFNDQDRTFKAIASTPSPDRQGDTIDQSGWVLDNFIKNPIIPWAHCYWELPVARCLEIGVVDGNLQMLVQFPPEGLYDFADTVWDMYRNGFMFAFSVGFMPIEYDGNWEDGYNFTKCELLEVSAVPVPANAGALVLAQKMGIMDSKKSKSMIDKMEAALNNLKEANGIPASKPVKAEVEETPVEEEVEETNEEVKELTLEVLSEQIKALADILTSKEEGESEPDTNDETPVVEEDTDEEEAKSLTSNDTMVQNDNMTEQKSGAAISAKNKEKIKAVMDGLQEVIDAVKVHHKALSDLAEGEESSQDDDGADRGDEKPDANDPDTGTDNDKSIKSTKTDKSKNEIEGEVKSADDESEDGADQEDEEENNEDESNEEVSEDENSEDNNDEAESEEENADEESEEETSDEDGESEEDESDEESEDDDLVDPDNLSDEDQAKLVAAVQTELDKLES